MPAGTPDQKGQKINGTTRENKIGEPRSGPFGPRIGFSQAQILQKQSNKHALACLAPIAALCKLIGGVVAELPTTMLPCRPMTINGPEVRACCFQRSPFFLLTLPFPFLHLIHTSFCDYRPRGLAWAPAPCFLTKVMAIWNV